VKFVALIRWRGATPRPNERRKKGKSTGMVGGGTLTPSEYGTALALICGRARATRSLFAASSRTNGTARQFALAVGEYNIRIGQPHAPGFLPVRDVRAGLVNLLVGEPHTALVWLKREFAGRVADGGGILACDRPCVWAPVRLGNGIDSVDKPVVVLVSRRKIALTSIVDSALVVSFVFCVLVCTPAGRDVGNT